MDLQTGKSANDLTSSQPVEIVCEEVSKKFPDESRPAVDQVSFQVKAGSFVVLLGPSGCGKTTLLKMINRLYEPTSGKIFIGGSEVHDLSATALRRRIGYVIQQVGLFPHMTIERNIAVVPSLLGWDRARIDGRIRMLLDTVSLPQEYRKKYPRQLSGGEQQRVGIGRALAANPAILLMDEPFAAVDAINRNALQEELIQIHRKVHKTILFVTHDVEEAFRLADKIVIMKDGKLIQYDTPLDIVTHPCNDFVQNLVGTQNMLRRLSLINVQSVLDGRASWASGQALAGLALNREIVIRPEDDLRSVLSLFLDSSAESLPVVDPQGREVGKITFADLKAALVENTPRPQTQE